MPEWVDRLIKTVTQDQVAVLVTVISVDGSAPREVGASMVVSASGFDGTIGGGNLEHTCISDARELLGNRNSGTAPLKTRRVSLGPSLGQCCGGSVELLFEVVAFTNPWLKQLTGSQNEAEASFDSQWLCRSIDDATTDDTGAIIGTLRDVGRTLGVTTPTLDDRACVVSSEPGTRWFCTPLFRTVPKVWVYGAGHVGQAVVAQLDLLDCDITWLDHREDWLARQSGSTISRLLTDSPDAEASDAPASAYHVVMTHSHALDFDICHALLKRGEFGWLGLIGSATKRQTFVNRLKQRSISELLTARLRCPIGSLQLESSVPSAIALGLAAELVSLWEQNKTSEKQLK